MTSGSDAKLVFISDVEGEFGRYVQYQTKNPLPVLSTEGLQASSWHWTWERHGAPQLNQRFERRAKRRMQGPDWAAWTTVKSIIESVLRTQSTNFETVVAYLRRDRLNLDAYKGSPFSYRSWDNQLRQPVLLHTIMPLPVEHLFAAFYIPLKIWIRLAMIRVKFVASFST